MQDFQRQLLEDLRGRVASLDSRVTPAINDPDLKAHVAEVRSTLSRIDQTVEKMINDPAIGRPELNRQHREIYQRLNENLFVIESYLVPPIERFTAHDRRLTRVVAKLGEQINWPIKTPIVVADSASYYMTFPSFQLMKVPASEDDSMLAYPDLVHEMTHVLMTKERGRLIGDFVNVLADYTNDQKKATAQALPQTFFDQWRSYWLEEFVCDMVAVYTTGPAFGSQHIRLISGMPARSFAYGKSHPPDEARVRAAGAVLRAMGNQTDADDVDQMWRDYIPTTGEMRPRDYDRIVPDELIDALARRVVDGCRALNLRTYDSPEVTRADDIVGMVAEGWRRFRSNAQSFATWQTARLHMLWNQLGLDGPVTPALPTVAPDVPPVPPVRGPHAAPRPNLRPVRSGFEVAA